MHAKPAHPGSESETCGGKLYGILPADSLTNRKGLPLGRKLLSALVIPMGGDNFFHPRRLIERGCVLGKVLVSH